MIIAVTGGRAYGFTPAEYDDLRHFLTTEEVSEFRHGGADGADWCAAVAAKRASVHVVAFRVTPADWKKLGKAAGPIRNGRMLREGTGVDLLIAYPGNDGTKDCIRQANGRKIEVVPSFAISRSFEERSSPCARWTPDQVSHLFL